MKKFLASLLALTSALLLTGCSHRHTIDTWSVDYYKHWHVCTECGEQTDVSAHDFGKDEICLICNSRVEINENGNILVTVYDSEGNVEKELAFDSEGNLIKDGNVKQ